MVYVEEKKTNLQSTVYFVDGLIIEVRDRVTQIMREYPPEGYGTFVFQTEVYDYGRRMKAEVRRSNSAD